MTHVDPAQGKAAAPPEELARRLFDCLNRRDFAGAHELWHDDLVEDFVVLGPIHGKARARAFFEELMTAFPDFELRVETLIGDETTAFVAWSAAGDFTGGRFQGFAPNGARIALRGVDRMEFSEGKLLRNTVYYDGAGFMRSLGMLPAQESLAEGAMKRLFNAVTSLKRRLGR